MPAYEIQISLKMDSGLLADYATNVWSVEADDVSAAIAASVAIRTLYGSLVTDLSSLIEQNGHGCKIYARADAPPRAPVADISWNLPANPTSAPLPTECAICISFQADRESGVSQARRRGRVYIGPLGTGVIDASARVAAATLTRFVNAGTALLAASDGSAVWAWQVYSQATGDSFTITNGWVDNELDTQRRRGRKATSRTTFT